MEHVAVSQECIDILKDRSTFSRIAQEMLDDIEPLHKDLSSLLHGENATTGIVRAKGLPHTGGTPSRAISEPPTIGASEEYSATVTATIQRAIDLLGNPFHYERKFEFEDFQDD